MKPATVKINSPATKRYSQIDHLVVPSGSSVFKDTGSRCGIASMTKWEISPNKKAAVGLVVLVAMATPAIAWGKIVISLL